VIAEDRDLERIAGAFARPPGRGGH
jgi:hypothetical protein